jgi:hypothetical protein
LSLALKRVLEQVDFILNNVVRLIENLLISISTSNLKVIVSQFFYKLILNKVNFKKLLQHVVHSAHQLRMWPELYFSLPNISHIFLQQQMLRKYGELH